MREKKKKILIFELLKSEATVKVRIFEQKINLPSSVKSLPYTGRQEREEGKNEGREMGVARNEETVLLEWYTQEQNQNVKTVQPALDWCLQPPLPISDAQETQSEWE